MSDRKIIEVDPELFRQPSSTTMRRGRKPKAATTQPAPRAIPLTVRQELLKRVKETRAKEQAAMRQQAKETDEVDGAGAGATGTGTGATGAGDFDSAMEVMRSAMQYSSAQKKVMAHTLRRTGPPAPDVPYGCLKTGGEKPTYRAWTQRSRAYAGANTGAGAGAGAGGAQLGPTDDVAADLQDIKEQLQILTNVVASSSLPTSPLPPSLTFDPLVASALPSTSSGPANAQAQAQAQARRRRTYRVGKLGANRVGVFLADSRTRRNIANEQLALTKLPIDHVRKYLKHHGLIKVGSVCPTAVLRKMFEAAMTTGEIYNVNKDVLLHNFLNSDDM